MTWAEEVSLDTHGDVDDCNDENVKYFRGLIRCRYVTNEMNTEVVKEIYFYTSNIIVTSYSPREYPQRGMAENANKITSERAIVEPSKKKHTVLDEIQARCAMGKQRENSCKDIRPLYEVPNERPHLYSWENGDNSR
ncbi:hypothetical protein GQX74_002018 [Glossina fuscipes]|nr:hypothetical protein GQX74_002018 [Glossina fuscipes]